MSKDEELRLAAMRAALWRATALADKRVARFEHSTVIAAAERVDETLRITAQLFARPVEATRGA